MRMLPTPLSSMPPGKIRVGHLHVPEGGPMKMVPPVREEFPLRETHGFANLQGFSVSKTSAGLGWSNAYMSIQTEGPLAARFTPAPSVLICVINSGSMRANIALDGVRQQIEAAPGCLTIVPDGMAFEKKLSTRVGTTHLYIRRALIDQIANELCNAGPNRVEITPRLAIFDPVLEQLAGAVRDALDDRPDLSGLYVDYLLGAIAARLIQTHSNVATEATPYAQQERLSAKLVERTRQLVEEKLDERLTTADLAAGTGLGPDQFGRLFKQAAGVTLYQFVIRCRVDRACRLLAETSRPIIEIAYDCGFADQVHLTRAFARIVGTTPAAFRKDRKK